MATKGRAQKGSRIPLTRDTKMTNYRFKFDGGKVEGHLDFEYIVPFTVYNIGDDAQYKSLYCLSVSIRISNLERDKQNSSIFCSFASASPFSQIIKVSQ